MNRIYTTFILLMFANGLFAQTQHQFTRFQPFGSSGSGLWPATFGSELQTFVNAQGEDNFVITGSYNDNGFMDCYVQLADQNFVPIWQLRFELQGFANYHISGTSIEARSGKEFIVGVVAYINGTSYKYVTSINDQGIVNWVTFLGTGIIRKVKFDPSTDEIVVYGEQDNDQYLAKLQGSSGTVNWSSRYSKQYLGATGRFIAGDVVLGDNGEMITVGTVVHASNGDRDAMLFRVLGNGTVAWAFNYGTVSQSEEGKGIALEPNSSSVVFTGTVANSRVFAGRVDISTGSIVWSKLFVSTSKMRSKDIEYSAVNDVYTITGNGEPKFNFSDRHGMVLQVDGAGTVQGLTEFYNPSRARAHNAESRAPSSGNVFAKME